MEQRRVRLGDIVDDYCPRERRLTNHAVVAIVEDVIQLTRCTTCDAEHAYKGGSLPKRRVKSSPAALYDQVLNGLDQVPARMAKTVDQPEEPLVSDEMESESQPVDEGAPVAVQAASEPAETEAEEREEAGGDELRAHRPLIRATLPRPEGQPVQARPIPEFTVRQPGSRGRFGSQGGSFRGNGSPPQSFRGPKGGGARPAGQRFERSGGRHAKPAQMSRRGGKKRSR